MSRLDERSWYLATKENGKLFLPQNSLPRLLSVYFVARPHENLRKFIHPNLEVLHIVSNYCYAQSLIPLWCDLIYNHSRLQAAKLHEAHIFPLLYLLTVGSPVSYSLKEERIDSYTPLSLSFMRQLCLVMKGSTLNPELELTLTCIKFRLFAI